MVHAEIEINAPPSVVREIFLDFPNLKSWHDMSFFNSIEVLTPGKTTGKELVPGDQAQNAMKGASFTAAVKVNTPEKFTWAASLPFIFTGVHDFNFTPHANDANKTIFSQDEVFTGLLSPAMYFFKDKTEQGWNRVNQNLKDAAEKAWTDKSGK